MTHPIPQPGRYREGDTGYAVTVLGCSGSDKHSWVSVRIPARDPHRLFHVLLGRFWDDYKEVN